MILAGADPLQAVRLQAVVMFMLLAAGYSMSGTPLAACKTLTIATVRLS